MNRGVYSLKKIIVLKRNIYIARSNQKMYLFLNKINVLFQVKLFNN